MGEKMGGDTDDYILSKFGVPSVTAELGEDSMYMHNWICKSQSVCFNILAKNTLWMEYIFGNPDKITQTL